MARKTVLYASLGPRITWYEADVGRGTLTERGSLEAPADVQYCWPDASSSHLYVATSDSQRPGGGQRHHLCAFRIEPGTGKLLPHGQPRSLAQRPIHMTLDEQGRHALMTHSLSPNISVQRIATNGEVGDPVPQLERLDAGTLPHQARALPSGDGIVMAFRGKRGKEGRPEQPGAIRTYGYRDGLLSNRAVIAPDGGRDFGPRHVDFDPQRRWMFVALGAQSRLQVYRLAGSDVGTEPLFSASTLARPDGPGQGAGAIHVHPGGRFVYVSNREALGRAGNSSGDNSIAVFSIDQASGRPTLIQRADTHGFHPRTFSLDPGGQMLVAANSVAADMATEGKVPPGLASFTIGADGRLTYVGRQDMQAPGEALFWAGMLAV